jgi:hypothetical protein
MNSLLQRRTDISDENCFYALLNVAMATEQQIAIVDLFLQRRTNISSDDCGFALVRAAKAGNTSTVDILLQRRTDISAAHYDRALNTNSYSIVDSDAPKPKKSRH